jgi:AcrR family transcriptional regulator
MSPRPYQLGRRQEAIEQTRARILAAAHDLLVAGDAFAVFTVDAVARKAGVARMTVYYQFGSKIGLLEALMDDLATRGQMERLGHAFQQPDPLDALDEFVAAFARFWSADRLAIRRLRSLAALDPDFEQAVRGRDEWRRNGARVILQRLEQRLEQSRAHAAPETMDEAVDLLYTLTSFETFDTLAGASRTPQEVTPQVQRLARASLGLETPVWRPPN